MKKTIFILSLVIITLLGGIFIFSQKTNQINQVGQVIQDKPEVTPSLAESEVFFPITEFEKRITKKPFGIYITPENSPVQPERFTGFHTGVDVEYEDAAGEVPVLAICDGEIVLAKWVAGYGGTIGLKCDQSVYALYGHLDPQSFTQETQIKKGETIAVLGEDQTQSTDFERKHLHFAISKKRLDLRGYVKNKSELSNWYEPQSFLLNLESLLQ